MSTKVTKLPGGSALGGSAYGVSSRGLSRTKGTMHMASAGMASADAAEEAVAPDDHVIKFKHHPLAVIEFVARLNGHYRSKGYGNVPVGLDRDPHSKEYAHLFSERPREQLMALLSVTDQQAIIEKVSSFEDEDINGVEFDDTSKPYNLNSATFVPPPASSRVRGYNKESEVSKYMRQIGERDNVKRYPYNPILEYIDIQHFAGNSESLDDYITLGEETIAHFKMGIAIDQMGHTKSRTAFRETMMTGTVAPWKNKLREVIKDVEKNQLRASLLPVACKLVTFYHYEKEFEQSCKGLEQASLRRYEEYNPTTGRVEQYYNDFGRVANDKEDDLLPDPSLPQWSATVELITKLNSPYVLEKNKSVYLFRDVERNVPVKVVLSGGEVTKNLMKFILESGTTFGLFGQAKVIKNTNIDIQYYELRDPLLTPTKSK